MRAVRFSDRGVELVERETPAGDGVRVRVMSAGICGSDLGFIAAGGVPVTPGHEIAGLTQDDEPVAVQPNLACGECVKCLAGASHLCAQSMAKFAGMIGLDGGFAEELVVHPAQLHRLPAGLDVGHGALVEPAAVAAHALDRLQAGPDDTVGVIGGSTIGIVAAVQLTRRGVPTRLVTRHAHQAAAAESLGVHVVDDPAALTAPTRLLDAAGSQSALDQAMEAADSGARIVTLGGATWRPTMNETAIYKELSLLNSLIYTADDFAGAARFLGDNPDVAPVLVTHEYPLDAALQAFATAGDRAGSHSIKVMLHPAQ